MHEMTLNEGRETRGSTVNTGNDPLNAFVVVAAGGFYSDILKLTENCDSTELKKALRAQISTLKGLYSRM